MHRLGAFAGRLARQRARSVVPGPSGIGRAKKSLSSDASRYSGRAAAGCQRLLLPTAAAATALATAAVVGASCASADSKPPSSFRDGYEMGEQLGAGAFGIVHKARCKRTGRSVAVKIIRVRS